MLALFGIGSDANRASKPVSQLVSKTHLKELIEQLLALLHDERLTSIQLAQSSSALESAAVDPSTAAELQRWIKTINSLCLRIVDSADTTALLLAFIKLLEGDFVAKTHFTRVRVAVLV